MKRPLEPFFLDGSKGRLFGLYFPVDPSSDPLRPVLLIPPFAEEMNRCRAMVGLCARHLAAAGHPVLVLDLYGTGDSVGEFEEASWDTWLDDLGVGVTWLSKKLKQLPWLWGIRSGAMLATDLAVRRPDLRWLLFWQPVISGKSMFTQYLRLRVTGSLELHGHQETTKELRERLVGGETLEIGGYYISPRLAADIDAAKLPQAIGHNHHRVVWLEAASGESPDLKPASAKLIDGWRSAGHDVQGVTFQGPLFWQLHERAMAPDLIELTVKEVGRRG